MPKLKQPASLQNAAMDALAVFLFNYCDPIIISIVYPQTKVRQVIHGIKKDISSDIPWHSVCRLSIADSLAKLSQVIAEIKKHIPVPLSMGIHDRYLKKIENLRDLRMDQTADIHEIAISQVLMDNKIIRLRCEGSIVTYFHLRDEGKFAELRLLDPSLSRTDMHPMSLENFHLKDLMTCAYPIRLKYFHLEHLTTFFYPERCSDDDLRVIGENCPVLKFLDVTNSKKVTDRGLRWLIPCSEMRSLIIAFCRVSHAGITELLSVLTEIEELSAWSNSADRGFDCFSRLDLETVYPCIKSFTIVRDRISAKNMTSVVSKFPNLTSLGISGLLTGDLGQLKPLKQLAKLDFSSATGFSWNDLKKLLPSIGVNITDLRTNCPARSPACISQSDLNLLFEICPNLELLKIHYRAQSQGEKLIIPPFKKLKDLHCSIPSRFHHRRALLEFGEMLELEDLLINRFHMAAETVESMILNTMTFPKLKLLRISEITGPYSIDDVRQIAIDNNLDLEILNIKDRR